MLFFPRRSYRELAALPEALQAQPASWLWPGKLSKQLTEVDRSPTL